MVTNLRAATLALILAAGLGAPSLTQAEELATATFAGGCFWCVESDFDQIPGVVETVSGYAGGRTLDPTYHEVTAGGTGHREAVRITYDPTLVTYDQLLNAFWHSVDPSDGGGQFCDRGASYATAIFIETGEERHQAEASKQAAEAELGRPIVTPIESGAAFYSAEDYHQDYYLKNPVSYNFYRWRCGRNSWIEDLWGEAAYQGIPDH